MSNPNAFLNLRRLYQDGFENTSLISKFNCISCKLNKYVGQLQLLLMQNVDPKDIFCD